LWRGVSCAERELCFLAVFVSIGKFKSLLFLKKKKQKDFWCWRKTTAGA
jgi:hypothetical protein